MTDIRLPRLLDDHLQETARLHPVSLQLHLTLSPPSTANMVLPGDAPAVYVRDLIELYDEQGSAGIFRVMAVEETVGRTRTVSLTHSLITLADTVIPAQGYMGTVRDTMQHLLSQQHKIRWALGDVEAPADLTVIFACEYVNLLEAMQTLLGLLPEGYALAFEQSGSTWLIHLRALPDTPDCEGRLYRNVSSVSLEMDGRQLCTRVFPFGAEVDHQRINLTPLTGTDYLDAPSADHPISRTFESDLIFDVPTLHSVAEMYLARHAQPETTITVDALDLSAATEESLDAFHLGKMCRIALPDFSMTLQQRIIAIDKPDVFGAPGQATLTLATRTKPINEAAEIDELVRLVTASKLLGGTVTQEEDTNRAYGSYQSPVVHYFDVEDWAAVLDVRIRYQLDAGASLRDVRIDGFFPREDEWKNSSFSAMPYLKRDALGQIAQGQHWVSFLPYGSSSTTSVGVSSTVTMTVIDKTIT